MEDESEKQEMKWQGRPKKAERKQKANIKALSFESRSYMCNNHMLKYFKAALCHIN